MPPGESAQVSERPPQIAASSAIYWCRWRRPFSILKNNTESVALDANELKSWTAAHFRSLKAKPPGGV
jgi:hypothetical protein